MKIVRIQDSLYRLHVKGEVDTDLTFDIIINHPEVFEVAHRRSYVFWDFFLSGNIHVYLPLNHQLSNEITSNLETIFKSFFFKQARPDSFHLSNKDSSGRVTWAEHSMFKTQSGSEYDGWLIAFNLIFKSEVDHSRIGFCDSFTGMVNDKVIISKKYAYANMFPSHICSHPEVRPQSIGSLDPVYCQYSFNQSECPYYSVTHETIASRRVESYGSVDSLLLNLNVFTSINGSVQYQIVLNPDNIVNYTMSVDSRTETTDAEALVVLDEIVSSYNDGFKTVSHAELHQEEKNQKPSYIMSLAQELSYV